MTDKTAIQYAMALHEFCRKQRSCQNCVFRDFACDHWECCLNNIYSLDTVTINGNYAAKRKNGGYI